MSRPAVIFGGVSPEHDISILTGLQAAQALGKAGREPHGLYWSKTGDWFEVDTHLEAPDFADGVPRKARPLRLVVATDGGFVGEGGPLRKERPLPIEACVICCHGAPGEDGTLQAALDLVGIPYTGPDVAAAALGMDKLAFGAVAREAGIAVLPRVAASSEAGWAPPFAGPYIVKPRFGGSSIGIATVADADAVRAVMQSSVHLRAGAVVEPYRADSVDLEIAVRTYPELALSAISKPERSGSAGEIYSYQQKYVGGEGMVSAPRQMNPELPPGVADAVRQGAAAVARLARVRGVARVDFLLDGDDVFLNEVNTIPGSLARHLWVDPVLPFTDLLGAMLEEAKARPTTAWTTAGADGSALRSAGTIASKLG
ncbi:MAG: D-alanine--D-alanine ligase family protein [Acidimicrobiales bacterium]